MINVVDKMCLTCVEQNLDKPTKPSFWYVDTKNKLYCKDHKLEGMVNLNCKQCEMCIELNIEEPTVPLYNFLDKNESEKPKPIRCKEHIINGMVDVVHNLCVCGKRPCRGPLFGKLIHCLTHALPNEVSNPNPKCKNQSPTCKEYAKYGMLPNTMPDKCEKHASDKHVLYEKITCSICGTPDFIDSTTNKCHGCMNPDIKKRVKSKENKNLKS